VGFDLLQKFSLLVVMFGGSAALVLLRLTVQCNMESLPGKIRTLGLIQKANQLLLIVLILSFMIRINPSTFKGIRFRIPDRATHKFWNVVSRGEGTLLLPMFMLDEYFQPMTWTQLITRRPILLNPDKMNIMVYVPHIGQELDKVLKKVYGFELAESSIYTAPELNKVAWETRSVEKWRDIRKEFGVTEVLTKRTWNLQLPVKAQDQLYILYEIPWTK
jgi:hypothetical protein